MTELEEYIRLGIACTASGVLLFMLAVDTFWAFYWAINAPREPSAFDKIMDRAAASQSLDDDLDALMREIEEMEAWQLTEQDQDGFSHIARTGDVIDFQM